MLYILHIYLVGHF